MCSIMLSAAPTIHQVESSIQQMHHSRVNLDNYDSAQYGAHVDDSSNSIDRYSDVSQKSNEVEENGGPYESLDQQSAAATVTRLPTVYDDLRQNEPSYVIVHH